jgi:probable phosphoglycerate mutase
MDIYLVRHGEAAASWAQAADPGLSELGHEQARAVARILHPRLASSAVVAAPLAPQTTAPLAAGWRCG